MPRALMLTGDAAEELDVMYPLYRVREAGWDCDVAALSRRDVQLVIHDFDPNSDAYTEKNGRKLPVDLAFAEVEVERYQALIIPGGRAPEYIRTDPDVRRITEYFFAKDLPVGTICHGPQVPAVYGLLQGRRTAAFPPLTGDMENAGATVVDAPDVVDGNMVSCRGWPDMPEWSRAFMAVLERTAGPRLTSDAPAAVAPDRSVARRRRARPSHVRELGTGPPVLLLHGSGPGTTGWGAWAVGRRGARRAPPRDRARTRPASAARPSPAARPCRGSRRSVWVRSGARR